MRANLCIYFTHQDKFKRVRDRPQARTSIIAPSLSNLEHSGSMRQSISGNGDRPQASLFKLAQALWLSPPPPSFNGENRYFNPSAEKPVPLFNLKCLRRRRQRRAFKEESVRRSQKEMSRTRKLGQDRPTSTMDRSVNSSPSRRSSTSVAECSETRMERDKSGGKGEKRIHV